MTGDLGPTDPLSNQQQRSLLFDDVPSVLSASEDIFELDGSSSMISGDFAFIGVTTSTQTPSADLTAYSDSVLALRNRPVEGSVVPGEQVVDRIDLDFYNGTFFTRRLCQWHLHRSQCYPRC